MTLADLIKRASRGYTQDHPDDPLTGHFDVAGTLGVPDTTRDALGWAVAAELAAGFNPTAKDADQLAEAVRVMERYLQDIENVIDALNG